VSLPHLPFPARRSSHCRTCHPGVDPSRPWHTSHIPTLWPLVQDTRGLTLLSPSHRSFDLQAVPNTHTPGHLQVRPPPSPPFPWPHPPPILTHLSSRKQASSAASANRIAFRKWRNVNQDLSTRSLIMIPYILPLPPCLSLLPHGLKNCIGKYFI